MKRWHLALLAVAAIAAGLYWQREPIVVGWLASQLPKTTLEDRVALIAPGIDIRLPESEGPFPVVVQLHGCAGIRPPFQAQWAEIANGLGYAAMIVDSNGVRGWNREQSLDVVCAGKDLIGQERAGDIAAALKIAADDARLDASRIILAGWSHGAWSAMDYLTMDTGKALPGFKDWSEHLPAIDGAILVYPYCGLGAHIRYTDYRQSPPMLALIAGADEVVDANLCIRHFSARKRTGADVEMTIYEGANHAFDDPFLEPEYLSWHKPDALEDAKTRYAAFLHARLLNH